MTSRDVGLIRKSGLDIINNSQNEDVITLLIAHRDDIYNATRNFDLGGAFATNNRFYEFPIEIIDFHRELILSNNTKCTCDLYFKSYSDFDPNKEGENPTIELFAKGIGDYTNVYGLKCNKCESRFHVSERHYHYGWYQWHPLVHDFNPPKYSTEADNVLKLYVDIIYTALDEKNKQKNELSFHLQNIKYYVNWLKTNEERIYDDIMETWNDIIEKTKSDLNRELKNKV
ncbi:hypothetical protein OO013_20080 [Mangrovivirga sp. M17]|uniref:C2H2-type domain-containing protein n=1 Tax=Mangrovivirga halotolerans TaxID=2993936 RepID=A0ABT3RYH5_9BACT|nr:hypothetical protein [Mangrovivirga halotolerans]MCX2746185.1 hypothetical protein [Mangrovivirga halotolerans]